MPFCKISCDVKLAAIRLYKCELLGLPDILDCCGFSEQTWFRILKLWQETGDVVNPQPHRAFCGRVCALDREDIDCLIRLIRQNPDYFLDEFMHLLKTNQFISVHFTTIFCELERAGVSYKKLKQIASEHNETHHAKFIERMAQYEPLELGFIDETSKDEQTPGRRYGRAKTGKCAEIDQVFVWGR
jgi:transposase